MLVKWTADSIWLYFQFPAKGTTNSWPYFMINVFVSECLGVSNSCRKTLHPPLFTRPGGRFHQTLLAKKKETGAEHLAKILPFNSTNRTASQCNIKFQLKIMWHLPNLCAFAKRHSPKKLLILCARKCWWNRPQVEEKRDSLNPEEGPKTLILFI